MQYTGFTSTNSSQSLTHILLPPQLFSPPFLVRLDLLPKLAVRFRSVPSTATAGHAHGSLQLLSHRLLLTILLCPLIEHGLLARVLGSGLFDWYILHHWEQTGCFAEAGPPQESALEEADDAGEADGELYRAGHERYDG
jgi:hypothetical protein